MLTHADLLKLATERLTAIPENGITPEHKTRVREAVVIKFVRRNAAEAWEICLDRDSYAVYFWGKVEPTLPGSEGKGEVICNRLVDEAGKHLESVTGVEDPHEFVITNMRPIVVVYFERAGHSGCMMWLDQDSGENLGATFGEQL